MYANRKSFVQSICVYLSQAPPELALTRHHFPWLPRSYDNPYDSFRQQRSSGYYDAITRNSVDAMVKRGERFGGGR